MAARLFVLMMILLVGLAGCTDDDNDVGDPVSPGVSRGTIKVVVEPRNLEAPWQLSEPAGYFFSGLGHETLENLLPGQYTITWNDVLDWVKPAADTQTLEADGTVTFTGIYATMTCHQWSTGPGFDQITRTDDEGTIMGPEAPGNWCPPTNGAAPFIRPAYPNPSTGTIFLEFGLPSAERITLRIFDDQCRVVRKLVDASSLSGNHRIAWTHINDLGHRFADGDYACEMTVGDFTCYGNIHIRTSEPPPPPPGFVYIPPGTFRMGSPDDEYVGRPADESPHLVTLTRGFYMSAYEVTEERWYQIMGGDPTTSQLPKNHVSWDMAVEFCNALSELENLTPAYEIHGPNGDVTWHQDANGYRLPTETEWEYACRANSDRAFSGAHITNLGCNDAALNARGWYCGNYDFDGPKVVGLKQPNAWGLYDMHGNVWEWVWCGKRSYPTYSTVDPQAYPLMDPVQNVAAGVNRIRRGGGFYSFARYCRSAYRSEYSPTLEHQSVGLRPVRTVF